MIHKLYDCVFDNRKDRKELYLKCIADDIEIKRKGILCSQVNTELDFCTYFNSFSIKKWKQYTDIKNIIIQADIDGIFDIEIYAVNGNNEISLKRINDTNVLNEMLPIENLDYPVIALKVISKQANSKIENITYHGDFAVWDSQKIGVVICTFQREEYVKNTIAKLMDFADDKEWLSVVVVDNGRTLEKVDSNKLKIIHNPNYGGSGGFTRGIIENLENDNNDYVLLMDDDIDIDTTALERTYSLLSALKDEYKESFLAGAMLNIDEPYMQYENTAYWNKIRLAGLGKNYDLSKKASLINNINIGDYVNHYAAWWYCCIPVCRIKKIGLPLPFFIKGDDIEYSIRNDRKIIFMNGIAVWHEPFAKKMAPWINYFSDRNMLILNFYAKNCNALTFFISAVGRLVKRCIYNNSNSINVLYYAINDVYNGFERITEIGADKKLVNIREVTKKNSSIKQIFKILWIAFIMSMSYKKYSIKYTYFRDFSSNKDFWNSYYNK